MTTYFVDTPPINAPSAIDMLNPVQVCERLALSRDGLRDLVNNGTLAAYDLGDGIRFRAAHVQTLATSLIAG